MDQWLIWVIFGALLALLVGFLVFTFVKDKRKNAKIIKKRYELKRSMERTSKELAIRIYTLIEFNDELVQNVKPGSSSLKMKDVNYFSRKFLKDIYDSKAFKTLYIQTEETDPNYSKNLKNLIDTKSNLWDKRTPLEIDYFKKMHDQLSEDAKFSTIKEDSQKTINEYFEKIKKAATDESAE